jgi:phosphoadenosine phosphosulfate reductase
MPDLPLSDRLLLPDRLSVDAALLSWAGRLDLACRAIEGRIVFTTSFGIEAQALLHLLAQAGRLHGEAAVEVVTFDTGRLFPETYALWRQTELHYGVRIRALHPRHEDLEALVARDGVDGFYRSIANRKACCAVRKIEPLRRALAGAAGWITGLRADQSATRNRLRFAAASPQYGVTKVCPLYDAGRDDVMALIQAGGVPYNALEDRGFRSIGCQPCTRAVAPGEPERAGRWWWETDDEKECGLHVDHTGKLVRARAVA